MNIIAYIAAFALPVSSATAQTTPGARNGALMVYDAARRHVVLFGGNVRSHTGADLGYPNDLWAWDGARWRELVPAAGSPRPPGRDVPHLAYDAARSRVVLFGGRRELHDSLEVLTDVWEWDGTRWHEMQDASFPRLLHAVTGYDAVRHRVLAYGGFGDGGLSRRLYEWDGARWSVRDTVGPANAFAGAQSSDSSGRWHVLMSTPGSGNGMSAPPPAVVWTWDGRSWARAGEGPPFANLQPTAGAPDGTLYFYQSWDCWLAASVMHIRRSDGEWSHTEQRAGPGMRTTSAAAYDPIRRRLVLYGGRRGQCGEPGGVHLSDTWEFDGTAWARRDRGAPPS